MLKLVIISVLALASAPDQDGQRPDSREEGARQQRHGGHAELFAIPPLVVPGLPVVTLKVEPALPQLRHTEVFTPDRHSVTTGPCNMPILVGDASADPGILIPAPHHGKHQIRTVAPRACGEKELVERRRR